MCASRSTQTDWTEGMRLGEGNIRGGCWSAPADHMMGACPSIPVPPVSPTLPTLSNTHWCIGVFRVVQSTPDTWVFGMGHAPLQIPSAGVTKQTNQDSFRSQILEAPFHTDFTMQGHLIRKPTRIEDRFSCSNAFCTFFSELSKVFSWI